MNLPSVTCLLALALLGASGCHHAPTKTTIPQQHVVEAINAPIEPQAAKELGYTVGWLSHYGDKQTAATIDHVRVLGDLLVYTQKNSDFVTAIDLLSGDLRWVTSMDEKFQTLLPPMRVGNTIYVTSQNRLHRIDALTGEIGATTELDTAMAAEPILSENYLVFSGVNGEVIFFNLKTGYPTWKSKLPSPIRTHAVTFGKNVFVVDGQGKYVMLSPENKEKVWYGHTWGSVLVDPAIYKDTIILPSVDGTLYGINRVTGKDAWKYPQIQAGLVDAPLVILSTAQIILTIPSEGIRILSAVNGTETARIPTSGRLVHSTDTTLFLYDIPKNNLFTMEVPSGHERVRVETRPLFMVLPTSEDSVILMGVDGQLMRLNPNK